jgi:hypothetical protein
MRKPITLGSSQVIEIIDLPNINNNIAAGGKNPTIAELDCQVIDGQALISDLYEYLGRFVAYPSEHARVAHALWCVHTHKMDAWDTTPRIAFLSPEPASGKTRALEITENVVPNAVLAVNMSPAYLFRKVGSEDGLTLLYDEIDTVFGPKAKENEEIRGLLNAGYRRGAVTGRCVMHGGVAETQEIPAYAPVALAGLGWLPDTILSRSIIIRMKRRAPGQVVEPYRRRLHAGHGVAIRDRLIKWAASTEFTLPDDLPVEIQDRDADIWEPIIAVADAIGGEWPKRARDAAVALVTVSKDIEPSLGIKLLTDIRQIFAGRDVMASQDIVVELVKLEESPWSDLYGKGLDQRGLAKRLREYDIRPSVHRISATVTARGYRESDFTDAWAAYLPPPAGRSVTRVTSVTGQCPPCEQWGRDNAPVTDVTDVAVSPDGGGANLAGSGAAEDLDLPRFLDRRVRAAGSAGPGGPETEISTRDWKVKL